MATDGRLTIRVSKKLRSRLAKLAKQRGQTESDLARQALETFVATPAKEESCYDAFKRAGFIGVMKDGPRDLSTNPKYLEGLGRD
jgi:hypothetical protein